MNVVHMLKAHGFTLMEIVVVLGIVLAVGLVALTYSIPQLQASQTDGIMNDMSSLMFVQQQNAYSGKNSKSYGMYFDSDAESYILFVGSSFATAESSDEFTFPGDTEITLVSLNDSSNEIVFSPGELAGSTYGFVRVSNGLDTFILEVNSEGLIYTYKE